MNLLNKCYSKCIGCRKYEWPDVSLPIGSVRKIIGFMKDRTIVFSGGEPFLYEYLGEALRTCSDNYVGVGLLSSCLWPNKYNDESFMKETLSHIDWISVSIDGTSLYKEMRGIDALVKVVENIKFIKKIDQRVKVRCNSTISKINSREMKYILALCNELEIDCNFFPMHTWKELKIDDMKSVVADVVDALEQAQVSKIKTNISDFLSLLNREKQPKCIIPYVHCFVDSDGEVFPCCRLANDNGNFEERNMECSYGNINNVGSLSELLAKNHEMRKRIIAQPSMAECYQCDRYNDVNKNYINWLNQQNRVYL